MKCRTLLWFILDENKNVHMSRSRYRGYCRQKYLFQFSWGTFKKWKSNDMRRKVSDEIAYLFPNFWEWISNLTTHPNGCDLIHVGFLCVGVLCVTYILIFAVWLCLIIGQQNWATFANRTSWKWIAKTVTYFKELYNIKNKTWNWTLNYCTQLVVIKYVFCSSYHHVSFAMDQRK